VRKILAEARKEWTSFRRDRLALALAFLLPIFSLLLFGFGIRLESKQIKVAVQDLDQSPLSREYIARLWATNILCPASTSDPKTTPIEQIDRGTAKVGVIIPEGFEKRILALESSPLQVVIDGTDISNCQIVHNTVDGANAYFLQMLAKPFHQNHRPIVPDVRIWFNPGRKESLFIVPGAFGVILWMYPALLAAVGASREKEQNTILGAYASHMSALEFLLGKSLIYIAAGTIMSLVVIISAWIIFDVRPVGDIGPIFVGAPLYIITSVLFGLMLGTYASSQTTAVQATSSLGFFPCLLLSGFVYPINNIPFPLSLFSIIVPARYFIEMSRETFVRGIGWPAVWPDAFALVIFVSVLGAATWWKERRMQLRT